MEKQRVNIVKEEVAAAADVAQKIVKMVMDGNESVGRGLLAGAFAYSILAKSSPVDVPLEDLHDILDAAYRMVTEAEGEGRVLQ